MNENPKWEILQREFAFLLENGFTYEYAYEKSSDKSCVYIHRFRKRGAYLELRQTSGGKKGFLCVVYTGTYRFPKLEVRQKKLFTRYRLKHLFKRDTEEELLALYAEALKNEIQDDRLYGIPVTEK